MKINILQVAIVVGLISTGNPLLQPLLDLVNGLLSPDNPKPDQGQTQQVNATEVCKISILGRCLDVANSTNGTPLKLATCTQSQGQDFTFYNDDTIRVFDKCVQVSRFLFSTPVQIYDCNSKPAQNWTVTHSKGLMENPSSNECMFVKKDKIEDGQTMITSACDSFTYEKQSFDYNCVPAPTVQDIQSGTCAIKVDDKCIGVKDATMASGTEFEINACDESKRQSLIVSADGSIQVFGKCMEVKDDQTVQLNDCNETSSQRWVPLSSGQLRNVKSNKCLDVQGGTVVDGTPLIINVCRTSDFSTQDLYRVCVFDPVPVDAPIGICALKVEDKCVAVKGGAKTSGTSFVIDTCSGIPAQRLTVSADGSIQALGKCMDVKDRQTDSSPPVQLNDCNESSGQQWVFLSSGQLRNVKSNECLDVQGGSMEIGTPMITYPCRATDFSNQGFESTCVPIPPALSPPTDPQPTGFCTIAKAGFCVNVVGGKDASGTGLDIFTCNEGPAQAFDIQSDGTIKAGDKCVDVKDTSTNSLTLVQLNDCNGVTSQQWSFLTSGQLLNSNSSMCLDLERDSYGDGVPLVTRDCQRDHIFSQKFGSSCKPTNVPPPPSPPKIPQPTGTCAIKVNGKCVGVNSDVSGTQFEIDTCREEIGQGLILSADKTIRVFGMCMDVKDGRTENSSPVQLNNCNGTLSQQWVFLSSGQLKNENSNRCLDVQGGIIVNGQPLIIYDCHRTDISNQAIESSCVPNSPPRNPQPRGSCQVKVADECITSTEEHIGEQLILLNCQKDSSPTLLADDGSIRVLGDSCVIVVVHDNSPSIEIGTCKGSLEEQWVFLTSGQLKNVKSNLCLEVRDGLIQDNQPVILNKCKSSLFTYQTFETSCQLPPPVCQIEVAGKCIGLTDGNGVIGTAVVLNPCSLNKPDQLWTMNSINNFMIVLGKCMDAPKTIAGTPVQVADCNGRRQGQEWVYQPSGQLKNSRGRQCLDIAGDKIVNWQPVVTNACKASNFGYQAFKKVCFQP